MYFMPTRNKSKGATGLSAFIVELKNFNGITVTDLDKLGSRSSPTGEIILENTKIPKGNILGKPGDGAKIVFGSLSQSRLSAAAGGIGLAQACLDAVTKYAMERVQFGQAIGLFQMNQDLIGQMVAEIEAARFMVYKAAWQKDQGNLGNNLEVAAAKYLAGELAYKCSQYAMRILGALRLFDGIPGCTVLPRCTDVRHGGRIRQCLQIYHGPGSIGYPQGESLDSERRSYQYETVF